MYTRKQTIYFSIILLRFKVVLFSLAKSHSSVCQRKEREKKNYSKNALKKCRQNLKLNQPFYSCNTLFNHFFTWKSIIGIFWIILDTFMWFFMHLDIFSSFYCENLFLFTFISKNFFYVLTSVLGYIIFWGTNYFNFLYSWQLISVAATVVVALCFFIKVFTTSKHFSVLTCLNASLGS